MKKVFALLLCLALTGCGASQLDEVTDPGWEEYQQQEELPEVKVPVYPSEFALAYHKDHTLDPINCGEGIQQDVASLLYEPLFQLSNDFEPEGVLCESVEWDESGLICTLYIRKGVLFTDETELKASDVAATLRRAMISQRYGYRLRKITEVNYSNRDMTVTVTLLEKNRAFPALLDIPVVKEGTEEFLVPVGTGAYCYAETETGAQLVANLTWWQQGTVPVDTISLVHAKDADTAIHLFTYGRVQLLTLDPTNGQSAISASTVETERVTTQLHFIGFNTMSGVFADSAARAAFNAGIQRDVLVDAFLSDHALAAQFPVSPLHSLYPHEMDCAFDRGAVLADIAAAGYDSGEPVELILLVNEEDLFRQDNAGYIAETLSVLDWKITVRVLPWTEYLVALQQGDFDLYYGQVRLCADWDATDLFGTDGTMNYGGFADVQMDQCLQEFREADDREAAAQRLYSYFLETVPIAPICFQNYIVLTTPEVVDGITTAPGNTFHSLEEWTIRLST